jgi:hypothetical protein
MATTKGMTMTNMVEANIKVRRMGTDAWLDSIDMDPVMITRGTDGLANPFEAVVIRLVDAIISADTGNDAMNLEYNVVWSDNGWSVKANCPVCDDVFPIAEGAPGDELNEGHDAVFCGCDPRDSEDLD